MALSFVVALVGRLMTPDHKMSGINSISKRAGGVRYTVRKLSTKATTLL